jgi:hypothetical protein
MTVFQYNFNCYGRFQHKHKTSSVQSLSKACAFLPEIAMESTTDLPGVATESSTDFVTIVARSATKTSCNSNGMGD